MKEIERVLSPTMGHVIAAIFLSLRYIYRERQPENLTLRYSVRLFRRTIYDFFLNYKINLILSPRYSFCTNVYSFSASHFVRQKSDRVNFVSRHSVPYFPP